MTTSAPALPFQTLSNTVRFLAIDAVEKANSGHPGMPMGMADVATVLFTQFLKVDPSHPTWPDRDRFVLSAGHGSMLLYAVNHLLGYDKLTLDEIKRFRQLGSLTAGHPEHDLEMGIEMTTGPLGQGLATAVGMALAETMLAAEFGRDLVDHKTYVIASDGDMMEGISHEAGALAGHLKLSRLIVLYDDNKICIDGPTSLSFSDDVLARFGAYGWATTRIDGHDPQAIAAALTAAQTADKPTLIACRTTIGFGAPHKANSSGAHGSPLGADEVAATRTALDWPYAPFEIPPESLAAWRSAGARHQPTRTAWNARVNAHPQKADFERRMKGDLPASWPDALAALVSKTQSAPKAVATRVASGQVLEALVPVMPELVGGSADLTPSNNTKTTTQVDVTPEAKLGRYLHWGVREHGMAAALNGLALHGGLIPYAGTFLSFADYARPALRLAALMKTRVIHVMTHDSIGLGEDGPTHQPVEHLAALRAIPNLLVLRPADVVETAECWALALAHAGPSVLALSRQNLPLLRTTPRAESLSAKGGYVLTEATGGPRARQVTLMATGSELSLAVDLHTALTAQGIEAAVVSLPCFEAFEAQPDSYKASVLGPAPALRVGIEAAIVQGWERYVGDRGLFCGMTGFGASGPAPELYRHFGLTVEAILPKIMMRLKADDFS